MQLPQLTKTVGSCLRVWSGTSMSKFVAKKEFKNRPRRETKGSSMFLMNTGEKVSTVGFPQPPPPHCTLPRAPSPRSGGLSRLGTRTGCPLLATHSNWTLNTRVQLTPCLWPRPGAFFHLSSVPMTQESFRDNRLEGSL